MDYRQQMGPAREGQAEKEALESDLKA